MFVARGFRRVRRVALQLEPFRDPRGHDRHIIINAHDAVNGIRAREGVYVVRRALRVLEIEREQTSGILRFECAALFGGYRHLDADLPCSLHERRRAVGRGRQQQQETRSYFFEAWK